MKTNMKKILLVIPLLLSYCSKSMEDPNANIDSTVESVRPGNQISELKVYREILEGICEVAAVLVKRKQTEEHGNQNQSKKAKRFKCNKCGHWYASKLGLNRHMQTHYTEKSYECDVEGCQKKFKTEASLRQHRSGVHGSKEVCDIKGCVYKTGFKSDLKKHKEHVHAEQKDYTCNQCDYASTSKYSLREHLQMHNREKLYECDVEGCQKTCKTASALNLHKKRTHSKKIVCGINECPYKTGSTSDLNRHKKRIHGIQKD